jgi:hypothetical protein
VVSMATSKPWWHRGVEAADNISAPVAPLFAGVGFTPEALLADQVRDDQGVFHDVLVLSHPVEHTWSTLVSMAMIEGGVEA